VQSRDSSVVTETRLDGRGSRVRFPAGDDNFLFKPCPERLWSPPSLLSEKYRGSFPGSKVART
jgi:hypothetical protein